MSWSITTQGKCSAEVAKAKIAPLEPSSSALEEEKASFMRCKEALLALIEAAPKSQGFLVAVEAGAAGHGAEVSLFSFSTLYVQVEGR